MNDIAGAVHQTKRSFRRTRMPVPCQRRDSDHREQPDKHSGHSHDGRHYQQAQHSDPHEMRQAHRRFQREKADHIAVERGQVVAGHCQRGRPELSDGDDYAKRSQPSHDAPIDDRRISTQSSAER